MNLKRHVDIGSLEYLSKKLRLAKSFLGHHHLGYEIGEASKMLHEAAQAQPEKDITRPWGPTKEDLIAFSKQRIGSTLKYLNGKDNDVQSCRKILIEVVKDLSNKSYTDSSCTNFKGATMNLKRYIDAAVRREVRRYIKDEYNDPENNALIIRLSKCSSDPYWKGQIERLKAEIANNKIGHVQALLRKLNKDFRYGQEQTPAMYESSDKARNIIVKLLHKFL